MSATYSVPEAAEELGISRDHAYRLIAAGEFPVPVIRLGRTIRIARRAIEQLLEGATP